MQRWWNNNQLVYCDKYRVGPERRKVIFQLVFEKSRKLNCIQSYCGRETTRRHHIEELKLMGCRHPSLGLLGNESLFTDPFTPSFSNAYKPPLDPRLTCDVNESILTFDSRKEKRSFNLALCFGRLEINFSSAFRREGRRDQICPSPWLGHCKNSIITSSSKENINGIITFSLLALSCLF